MKNKNELKFEQFDKPVMESKAIPAAMFVKQEILNVRAAAVANLGKVIYRRTYGKNSSKEEAALQSNVFALFFLLRERFNKNTKSRNKKTKGKDQQSKEEKFKDEMDKAALENKQIEYKKLYEMLCSLNEKIDSMGITEIEISRLPEERTW